MRRKQQRLMMENIMLRGKILSLFPLFKIILIRIQLKKTTQNPLTFVEKKMMNLNKMTNFQYWKISFLLNCFRCKGDFQVFVFKIIFHLFSRFVRVGPNATLQMDNHKEITKTPDGKYIIFVFQFYFKFFNILYFRPPSDCF